MVTKHIRLSVIAQCLLVFIAFMPAFAVSSECRKLNSVCVDTAPVKYVQGLAISVSQVGGCWEYEDSYECLDANKVDNCSAISKISGCFQTNSVCSQYAFNGECAIYTNSFHCSDEANSAGVIKLENDYTVTTDRIDRSQCAGYENNSSCTLSQKICTEAGGTRIINGLPITKDCWNWQETYSCIAQNYANYCIPLRQTSGCVETGRICKSTAWNGTCNEYERTYRCDSKQGDPLPVNISNLNVEYTITKDVVNTSQCDANKSNANCSIASHTCTQPGGTRNINGLNVYKDCWEWTDEYVCASDILKSDCAELRANSACSEEGATCLDRLPAGQCGLLERKFQCKTKEGATSSVTTCDSRICVNGDCSGPSTNPDGDFGKAIASLEAAREMGTYLDPSTMQLFKGAGSTCSVKLGGLSNCCDAKGSGGGTANNYLMQGVMTIGNEAVRFAGSSYVYDALFTSDLVPTSVLGAIYGSSSGNSYTAFGNGSLNFYGLTYIPGGTPPMTFDPYSFAVAIAVQVITKYLSCNQSEQVLGMKKGQGLCTYVGSWCSSKVLGACVEKSQGYCCFNSKLSRIINEQGRGQIGKGWGNPQSPDCSGFTTADLNSLDFGKMDLSEFISDITPKNLNQTLLNDRATKTIQEKSTNYFNSGSYSK